MLFTAPVPHQAAIDFLNALPALPKRVWRDLLPELHAAAFTIAGIESADVLQSARNIIAKLPAGTNFDDVKDELLGKISPYFSTPEAAERRAELLLRHWGGIAYAATQYRLHDAQKKLFPYLQYVSMEDGKVRQTHRALNGIVLPFDSPFWQKHYPPWEPFCRCQAIPISRDDYREIEAADQNKPPDKQRILTPAMRDKLENQNILVRGPSDIFDVRTPADRGEDWSGWNPADLLRVSVPFLTARYDPPILAKFQAWAEKKAVPGSTKTLWQWLQSRTPLAPEPSAPSA